MGGGNKDGAAPLSLLRDGKGIEGGENGKRDLLLPKQRRGSRLNSVAFVHLCFLWFRQFRVFFYMSTYVSSAYFTNSRSQLKVCDAVSEDEVTWLFPGHVTLLLLIISKYPFKHLAFGQCRIGKEEITCTHIFVFQYVPTFPNSLWSFSDLMYPLFCLLCLYCVMLLWGISPDGPFLSCCRHCHRWNACAGIEYFEFWAGLPLYQLWLSAVELDCSLDPSCVSYSWEGNHAAWVLTIFWLSPMLFAMLLSWITWLWGISSYLMKQFQDH